MHTLSTMRRDMIKIETYWNVNKIITAIVSVFTAIKIETYWNVNFLAPMLYSVVPFELK